jgi:hypothetical protein
MTAFSGFEIGEQREYMMWAMAKNQQPCRRVKKSTLAGHQAPDSDRGNLVQTWDLGLRSYM